MFLSNLKLVALAATLSLTSLTVSTDTTGSGLGGVISWVYSVSESAVEALGAFETYDDKFLVTVDDGHGGTSTQLVTITVIGTQPLVTEPVFWVNSGSGDCAQKLNWSSAQVPGAGDDVGLIDHAGNYVVTSSINETIHTASTIAGTKIDITGGTFTL